MGSSGDAPKPAGPPRRPAAALRGRVLWAFLGMAGAIFVLTLIVHVWIKRRARERAWDQVEIIERTVSNVSDGGSDMPDAEVTRCIVRGIEDLSFPQPERGIVTVVAPFLLAPAG